jgi:hypothetical protein
VTGGYVYGGNAIEGLRGRYLFGDFVSARVWSFRVELYIVDYADGEIYRILPL